MTSEHVLMFVQGHANVTQKAGSRVNRVARQTPSMHRGNTQNPGPIRSKHMLLDPRRPYLEIPFKNSLRIIAQPRFTSTSWYAHTSTGRHRHVSVHTCTARVHTLGSPYTFLVGGPHLLQQGGRRCSLRTPPPPGRSRTERTRIRWWCTQAADSWLGRWSGPSVSGTPCRRREPRARRRPRSRSSCALGKSPPSRWKRSWCCRPRRTPGARRFARGRRGRRTSWKPPRLCVEKEALWGDSDAGTWTHSGIVF